jgi:hypothetical protein
MTYTINGKEWTKADINERCAVLMGFDFRVQNGKVLPDNPAQIIARLSDVYEPCSEIQDTDAIIDKCWDELNQFVSGKQRMETKWIFTMQQHNCTKLIAACICYIEINEGKL